MSSVAPGAHAPGNEYAAASRLRRITPRGWRCPGRECGCSAAPPHENDGDTATSVAASRLVDNVMPVFLGLTPQAMDMSPLRGFARPAMKMTVTLALRTYGRSPHFLGGDSRRAPKARQTFSLGREPQEWDRAPSVKPRSGDRYLAWGVSPRKPCVQHRPAPKGRQTLS